MLHSLSSFSIHLFIELAQAYYPERLAKCYILHMPWFFVSVWRMVSRFLEKATLEKVSLSINTCRIIHLKKKKTRVTPFQTPCGIKLVQQLIKLIYCCIDRVASFKLAGEKVISFLDSGSCLFVGCWIQIVIVTNDDERRSFIEEVGEEAMPEEYGGRAKLVPLQDVVLDHLEGWIHK